MLLGNYSVLHKSPTKFMSGTIASGDRANWNKGGLQRNMGAGTNNNFKLASIPMGFGYGGAWLLPNKAGGMVSRSLANLIVTPIANIYGGITTNASASITITFATASGELISSGNGTASFAITSNNPLLTASISGTGSSSFSIISNTPILGAEASLFGTSSFILSTNNPVIYPLNDASQLRTATAIMTITGNLTPYALGIMSGTTEEAGLTNAGIANSVWNSFLSNYNEAGTAGKALATASSGGVDLVAMAQAILDAAQITPIHSNVKQMNSANVLGTGIESDKWRGNV